MIIYLIFCIITFTAGWGLLRLIGVRLDFRHELWIAPALILSFLAISLGFSITCGMTVRGVRPFILLAVLLLSVIGIWRQNYRLLLHESPFILLAAMLPVALMSPYFIHGITTYLGSPAMDGWSYIAFGQYILDYPKGSSGGLAPLYQYASHLCGARFIARALLAFFSFMYADETQAVSGYFLAWSIFVFSCSCMFFIITQTQKNSIRIFYNCTCVFSCWIINLFIANNYDNALFLYLLPAFAGIGYILSPNMRWSFIIALLLSAGVYIYPEMSPVLIVCSFILMCPRKISNKKDILKWIILFFVMLAVTLIVLSPYLSEFARYFMQQFNMGMRDSGPRPGGTIFSELITPGSRLVSFWGLWNIASILPLKNIALFTASILTCFFLFGLIQLFKNRAWGILMVFFLLFAGYLFMAFQKSYPYGAYKFILLNWWIVSLIMITGGESLAVKLRTYGYGPGIWTYFGVTWSLLMVCTLVRIIAFDISLPTKSIETFKKLKIIKEIIRDKPLIVMVDEGQANAWAVYYLRDIKMILTNYRGYMAQKHLLPYMDNSMRFDIKDACYVLTDGKEQFNDAKRKWSEGPYRLWELPKQWAIIGEIKNQNGIEQWNNEKAFWLNNKVSEINLFSNNAGRVLISGQFCAGPSLPGTRTRHVLIRNDSDTYKNDFIFGADGLYSFTMPIKSGNNHIFLSVLDKASLQNLPSGDTRIMLVGIRGLQVKYLD